MVPKYTAEDVDTTIKSVSGGDATYVGADDVVTQAMIDDTNGNVNADRMTAEYNTTKLDPTILSIGVAYTANIGDDELWLGLGYQEHDEFAAVDASLACEDSSDETIRYAARYIHDWGNGHSTRISWAYEEMEYDWKYCGGTAGEGPFDFSNTGGMVDIERDAWLISGKHDFPGPLDFRFMYMEADDFDCGSSMVGMTGVMDDPSTTDMREDLTGNDCGGGISESSSGAEAFSVGLFYTMPAGTELRLVYGEVDNDANSRNGLGISGGTVDFATVAPGKKEESLQFGVVQWF